MRPVRQVSLWVAIALDPRAGAKFCEWMWHDTAPPSHALPLPARASLAAAHAHARVPRAALRQRRGWRTLCSLLPYLPPPHPVSDSPGSSATQRVPVTQADEQLDGGCTRGPIVRNLIPLRMASPRSSSCARGAETPSSVVLQGDARGSTSHPPLHGSQLRSSSAVQLRGDICV